MEKTPRVRHVAELANSSNPRISKSFWVAIAAFTKGFRLALEHPRWLWAGLKMSAVALLGGLLPTLLLMGGIVWLLLWAGVPALLWGAWSGWWDVLLLMLLVFPLTLLVWRAVVEELTEAAQAALAGEVVKTLDPAHKPTAPSPERSLGEAVVIVGRSLLLGVGLLVLGFVPFAGVPLAFGIALWFSAESLALVWLEALASVRGGGSPKAKAMFARHRAFWTWLALLTLGGAVTLNVLGGLVLAVGVVGASAAYLDLESGPTLPNASH